MFTKYHDIKVTDKTTDSYKLPEIMNKSVNRKLELGDVQDNTIIIMCKHFMKESGTLVINVILKFYEMATFNVHVK